MKQTRKIFVALMVLMTILMSLVVVAIPASAAEDGTWELVTDVSTLKDGDKVVIAAMKSDFAISKTQNSNNRAQAAITKTGNTITFTSSSNVQEFTLKNGKTAGTFAFYTGSGYLYAASSSKNYLRTETSLSANSSWNITISSTGVATIKATGTNTRNWLRYNSSNNPPLFAAYGSGQADVCIYKFVVSVNEDCKHESTTSTPTAPTCTAAGFTSVICNDCGTKIETIPGEPALGHTDANGDFKCERCSGVAAPAADEALTTEQANTLGKLHAHNTYTDNKYYVTGTITKIENTQYGNLYIKDASGKEFYIYGLYSSNGSTRYDAMTTKPQVYDEVTVYGIIGQFNSSAQMKNAWLDELVVHKHNYNTVKEVVAPTATTEGYTVYSCSCGLTENRDYVPTLLAGAGTEVDPYVINDVEDLIKFRDSVNNNEPYYNTPGVWVVLGADIDLAGINWTPIGNMYADHGYMGNFDGNDFKIYNLTIDNIELDSDGYAYAGFFGLTEGEANAENIVKNVIIENVTINTTGHIVAAAIAYPYYTTVDNIKVCGNININGGNYTSGVLAYTRRCVNASDLYVEGNEGSTITGRATVGGVISDIQMNGGLTANYSNFNISGVTISGRSCVGGISGIICNQTINGASVKNVVFVSDDCRVGVVSGAFGGKYYSIIDATYENVTGAGLLIGGQYDPAARYVAVIGDTYYTSVSAAIEAAVDGDVIYLAPGVISEEIIHSNNKDRFGGKNITIVGSEYGTTLTGGLHIGYDDNVAYTGSVVVKNITFEGKGLTLTQLDAVTVADCKFYNVENNAILVIADSITESITITGNVIDGAKMGIRVRNVLELVIDGNKISNTQHNSITVEHAHAANNAPITITNNDLTNWGLGGEGRAMRIALGAIAQTTYSLRSTKVINISGNELMNDNAPEEFIKFTDVDASYNVTLADNMLVGDLPAGTDYIALSGSGAEDVDLSDNVSVGAKEPHILDGYWWIGSENTGVKAEGADGTDGEDGDTPYIGENGNWWIGETDTGVKAEGTQGKPGQNGADGEDGNTPYIGENGNWWIGETDTGVKAEGIDGENGKDGVDGEKGDKGDQGIQGEKGDNADATKEVRIAIAIATVAIIFALAVLLFWRVKRRSWWCYR